jgi:hypothetical protein
MVCMYTLPVRDGSIDISRGASGCLKEMFTRQGVWEDGKLFGFPTNQREKIRPDETQFRFCPSRVTQKNVAKGEMPRQGGHRTRIVVVIVSKRDLRTRATLGIVASS